MAFVFKSSKYLVKPIEKEYDILSSKRNHKIKKNSLKKNKTKQNNILNIINIKPSIPRKQSAFGSNQKRDFLYLKLNQCSPGPGCYNLENNFIKKSFNNMITSPENKENNNDNDFFDENNFKLFISKEERFQNKPNQNPGPGEYNIMKLPHIKKDIFNRKNEIKKNRSYIANSPNREISIPSKGNNYGYIINKNGEKKLEHEPNLSLNSNIGPGSYDIKIPNWKINMVDWSRNSSFRNLENKENNKTREELVNNIDMIINEINKMKIKDKLLNNIETEPHNYNSYNGISILNSKELKKLNNYDSKDKENNKRNKNKITKYDKINDTNDGEENNLNFDEEENCVDLENVSKLSKLKYKYLKLIYDDYHDKQILKKHIKNKSEVPGPGKYSQLGQFEMLANFQKNNNFGSSLSRGLLYPITRNKIKIGRQKLDKNLRIYSSLDENNLKSNTNAEKDIKLNNNKKILNKNKSVKESLFLYKIKKKDSKNKYNTEEKEKIIIKEENNNKNNDNDKTNDFIEDTHRNIINNSTNVENFGILEKRFYEKPIKEVTPGVGSYSLAKNPENNINKYKSNSPYNIVIHNLKKKSHISDFLKNKIHELNHKSPGVGSYSPELKNCIEYDCNKKKILNSGKKVAFSNEEERFFKVDSQKKFKNDVGKYNIIKDKIEVKQQKTPFSLNEEKNKKIKIMNYNIGNNNDKNLGPGAYRYGSYFDWIKKSFNKNFI